MLVGRRGERDEDGGGAGVDEQRREICELRQFLERVHRRPRDAAVDLPRHAEQQPRRPAVADELLLAALLTRELAQDRRRQLAQ